MYKARNENRFAILHASQRNAETIASQRVRPTKRRTCRRQICLPRGEVEILTEMVQHFSHQNQKLVTYC